MSITQETRLKKAHVSLMRHSETALYSGIIMMGDSLVVDDDITAYTDGVNKKYGRKFIENLNDSELRALILHENLHVALKHIQRFDKEFKQDARLTNASADYVVNDIIVNLEDKAHCVLPKGGLYDEKYHNWSVREVYNDLKQQQDENPQSTDGLEPMDEHGFGEGGTASMSAEEQQALSTKIDQALREGGILASRMGGKTPKTILNLLEPKVDWRTVLKDFLTSAMRGTDEYTWRRYNKRLVANDIYMPSMEDEQVGEIVVAIDTSGSIGDRELTEFASELVSVCELCSPEKVRVLWWDTEVHGEQVFDSGNYQQINHLLKPQGGGGTDPSCISKYIASENITAQAVVVFTDGYFWDMPEWNISTETLWLVTENTTPKIPTGKVIKQELKA